METKKTVPNPNVPRKLYVLGLSLTTRTSGCVARYVRDPIHAGKTGVCPCLTRRVNVPSGLLSFVGVFIHTHIRGRGI